MLSLSSVAVWNFHPQRTGTTKSHLLINYMFYTSFELYRFIERRLVSTLSFSPSLLLVSHLIFHDLSSSASSWFIAFCLLKSISCLAGKRNCKWIFRDLHRMSTACVCEHPQQLNFACFISVMKMKIGDPWLVPTAEPSNFISSSEYNNSYDLMAETKRNAVWCDLHN